MKRAIAKKVVDIMPKSKWYLSQRGMKAADEAFGPVTLRKKAS